MQPLPPPYSVHADLTVDESTIVLMAAAVDDHWLAYAARLLQTLTPLIEKSYPPGALTLPVSWPAVVQLSHTYGAAWRPGPRLAGWMARQVAARTAPVDGQLRIRLPAGLRPYHWQVSGAQMIDRVGRILITDEPRTGKTLSAILGVLLRSARSLPVWPVLVVCPASVVDPWVEAWRTWAPGIGTVAWRGTPAQRQRLAGRAQVYVSSYETAWRDAPPSTARGKPKPLIRMGFGAIIIDECHFLKSADTHRSMAVRRLSAKCDTVIALSGTPITHNPGDLWATMDALDRHAWPSKERWVARYCLAIGHDYGKPSLELEPLREPEFRLALLGAHRRVARADVLADLPGKTYVQRTVTLPPEWRRVYDEMEADMLARLPGGVEAGEMTAMSVLAQLTRLSQLACAAADVRTESEILDDGTEKIHQYVTLKMPSWKVDALLEVLAEQPGESVLVFAPSRQLIMLAGEACAQAGYRVGYVVGGQTQAERTTTRTAFQNGELDVLLATTGAGGTGLTLTRAGVVVFLQRPWSLVESSQAEDRAEGIGSATPRGTEIIDVISRGTIDARIRSVLRGKAGQLAALLEDPRILTELLGGTGRHAED